MNHLELVNQQVNFYRNNFRRLIVISFVLLGVILLLLGLVFYQLFSRPTTKYFVTTQDGRLIEIHPMGESVTDSNSTPAPAP